MHDPKFRRRPRLLWWLGALLCTLLAGPAAQAQDSAALKARHAKLVHALAHNAFEQPLVLESTEEADKLRGDVYALIEQPFARLAPALQGVTHWCEILILHLNVKQCRAGAGGANDTLALVVGRKFDQPVADAYRIEFAYQRVVNQADYLQIVLQANEGPLDTRRLRIVVEAVALDAQHSFLHLSYAYEQGLVTRLAVQAYLATIGRDKVGFSVVGRQPDGAPIYIGQMRGVIERNTMRYYLAIEAYLGALDTPPSQQLAKRLNDWHSGVERYPVQLHELERAEYLALKRGQLQRPAAPGG